MQKISIELGRPPSKTSTANDLIISFMPQGESEISLDGWRVIAIMANIEIFEENSCEADEEERKVSTVAASLLRKSWGGKKKQEEIYVYQWSSSVWRFDDWGLARSRSLKPM